MLAISCRQVDNGNTQDLEDSTSELSNFKGSEQMVEVYHRFPSPEEMLAAINVDGVTFNASLVNSSDKNKEYLDSRSQALNLGVYAADVAYLTLFNQYKESMKYFEALYLLSDKLRISSAFEISLLKRVQENMTNADSLKAISDYTFTSISNYLASTDNEKTFALISIGGFIESLYLSFNIVGDYSETNPLVQKITDQKFVLENIISFSNQFKDDKTIVATLEQVEPIRVIYEGLLVEKSETTITKDENGKLVIKGGSKLSISKEQYIKLREVCFKIRNSITQN
jgi:hypothetical protein